MSIGMTPAQASRTGEIPRSENWIRAGIRLGRIKAERIGRYWIIPQEEIERLRSDMPVITGQELVNALRAVEG